MKVILVLLLVGFSVAKPAFDFEEEFIQDLLRDDEDPSSFPSFVTTASPSERPSGGPGPSERPSGGPDPSERPSGGPGPSERPSGGPGPSERPFEFNRTTPSSRPKPDEKDIPLFHKFAYFLFKVSVGDVKPDEHPDLKYKQPGEQLVKKLLGVRKAVIATLKPIHDIAKLMIQDHIEMAKRIKEAVDNDNIHRAKHVAGEYFIALNRRFLTFFVHAEQSGLFEKIGDDKDDKDMQEVRREMRKAAEESGEKGKKIAEFILKNFNEFRVSDGLPDRPFVKLGVETAVVLARTFKQMEKVSKISMKVYIDMVSDIVRLALKERNHKGAIQRAGSGVLSMVRRQTKIGVTLHHMYSEKKCFGPRPDKEGGKGGKGEEGEEGGKGGRGEKGETQEEEFNEE